MRADLGCCALMNSSDEDIMRTLCLIGNRIRPDTEVSSSHPLVAFSRNMISDPMYVAVRAYGCEGDKSRELLDLNYHRALPVRQLNSSLADITCKYSKISSTVALCMSLELPQGTQWTDNT